MSSEDWRKRMPEQPAAPVEWQHTHTKACRRDPELGRACFYSQEEVHIRKLERRIAELEAYRALARETMMYLEGAKGSETGLTQWESEWLARMDALEEETPS